MRCRLSCVLIFIAAGLSIGGAAAQTGAEAPQPVFPKLFPQPTGKNGYEGLVMAGDLAKSSTLLTAAMEDGGTLTLKRRALADPPVARALLLLKAALERPIASPHVDLDESTALPELPLFRSLARLIGIQEYVFLADGRTSDALESMRTGLRMGYVIQSDTMISGLVGIACDAMVIRYPGDHLDQLPAADCDRLVSIVSDWLTSANRAPEIVSAESSLTAKILTKYRRDPAGLLALLKTVTALPDAPSAQSSLSEVVQAEVGDDPVRSAALIDGAVTMVHTLTDEALANLALPPWARKPVKIPDGDPVAAEIVDALGCTSVSEQAMKKYTEEQVRMQLLGVHAAIHRYRWEYDRLPANLAILRLGPLAIDPFTGKTLGYEVKGFAYDLYSAGPVTRDANGVVVEAGGRIYFPRKS